MLCLRCGNLVDFVPIPDEDMYECPECGSQITGEEWHSAAG